MPTITRVNIASAAAEGRSTFVDLTLNDFVERYQIAVSDDVREYLLDELLEPDEAWHAGVRSGVLDAARTQRILHQALKVAADQTGTDSSGEIVLSREFETAIHYVIADLHNCPFPLILC